MPGALVSIRRKVAFESSAWVGGVCFGVSRWRGVACAPVCAEGVADFFDALEV